MAEVLGVIEALDSRTITAREHTIARRQNRMPVISVVDPDAASFLAAAGIVDPIITDAVSQLASSLKSAGLWAKLKAIWPMVGGTASTHKWNLKDPRDVDAAFRLAFFGTWTHSPTGAFPASGYADTFFNPATQFSASDGSLGFYSRTATTGPAGVPNYDMGCASAGDARATIVICRYHSGLTYLDFGTADYPNVAQTDGRGLFVTNRNGASNTTGYKNGAKILNAADDVLHPNFSFYIGANNTNGSPAYYSTKECAFAFTGAGMTDAEQASLYSAIQAFQTTLSRNV